ncbi:MAG TPA: thioredoxin-dependent thiol peroxidase [Candidatus Hydrogenedentes bacterium]|nr:thioredoxin-dependent thiol peroxidase [Candidatus Hydrogenedentota bacterium]
MSKNAKQHPLEGKRAPAFTLKSCSGAKVRLADLKGKIVVLYFYPKDNTSGCTIEAKGFRDAQKDMTKAGALVLGVSPDSVASHCRFRDNHDLNFDLLADPGHAVAEKYGVWIEKSMYGRKYMGVQRATFLIDQAGKICHVWPKVKPQGHAKEVLEAVSALK